MRASMQDYPLTLDNIFHRAEALYGDHEIITGGPAPMRYTYADWADRTRRLATALDTLGLSDQARVATFCWNHSRHLELYFAAPCSGRVLHTLNIRLFPEQVVYIANHAEDEVVFVDRTLLPLLQPLLERISSLKQVVVIDDVPEGSDGPEVPKGSLDYEELIRDKEPAVFNTTDERRASAMCYTSGTTGNPKGVTYSHRSTWLHSMQVTSTGSAGMSPTDRVMPLVPMFHANAWGMAHAAPLIGATLIFPGADMSPAGVGKLIEDEKVTLAGGVPTLFQGLVPMFDKFDLSSLKRILCGGSVVPPSLIDTYKQRLDITIHQAWGMTETSPIASAGLVDQRDLDRPYEEVLQLRGRAGIPTPGVEARIADPETNEPQPWDDEATGELQVRGPWVSADYYQPDAGVTLSTPDGWMKTGDVAAISKYGSIRIVDRTKDLVKSGGEWISSVDIEVMLMAHPAVLEAAIIGIPHPKWDERPVAFVVLKDGEKASAEELLDFLRPKIAKWWIPDAIEFIDEVPKTSVGKFSKKDLRTRFADYKLV